MIVKTGDMVSISLANGVVWPAVAITDEVKEPGNTRDGTPIQIARFDCISQRISREEQAKKDAGLPYETYKALTSEVSTFGFRPVARPRFTAVVGLDVTADGEKITVASVVEEQEKSYSDFQLAQFNLRNGATDAGDL